MRRLLVRRGGGSIAIDLDQDELRGIVLLLEDIESNDPRLLEARLGIGERRVFEGFHGIRFGMNMDVNNEHIRWIRGTAEKFKFAPAVNLQAPFQRWEFLQSLALCR